MAFLLSECYVRRKKGGKPPFDLLDFPLSSHFFPDLHPTL